MSAKKRPSRAAAPVNAAQMSRIDVLGDLEAWYRATGQRGYSAVLTFCGGSADVAPQSKGR